MAANRQRGGAERPTAEYTESHRASDKGHELKANCWGKPSVWEKFFKKFHFNLNNWLFFLWSQWLLLLVVLCPRPHPHPHRHPLDLRPEASGSNCFNNFYIYIYILAQLKHGSVSWYWKVCSQVIVIVMGLVAIVVGVGVVGCCCSKSTSSTPKKKTETVSKREREGERDTIAAHETVSAKVCFTFVSRSAACPRLLPAGCSGLMMARKPKGKLKMLIIWL